MITPMTSRVDPDRVAAVVAGIHDRAECIIEAELARLAVRVPQLSPSAHAAVATTVDRVARALLQPALARVAAEPESAYDKDYAGVLSLLFALDLAVGGR